MGRRKEWRLRDLYIVFFITIFWLLGLLMGIINEFLIRISSAYGLIALIIISFILSFILLYFWNRYKKNHHIILKRDLKDIRYYLQNLSPYEFEDAVADMFRAMGYKNVKKTSSSKDYGADIIMEDKKSKYVVEVKKYADNNLVGRPLLQKLQGASDYYRATGLKFVTLGYYSNEAFNYAKQSNIHLIDGDELINMFKNVRK